MATAYEMNPQIEEKGFENYMDEKMINKWKPNYFPYRKVKNEISQKYQSFVNELKQEGRQKSSSNEIEIIFFGNNMAYSKFIDEVDKLIMSEFSKVLSFHI